MKAKKPIITWQLILCTLVLLWMLAFLFAPPHLAAWLYGTDAPVRDQIRTAKLIIAAPFAVPLVLFVSWLKWQEQRNDKAARRREHFAAKLADPSRELRLDRGSADVD